MWKKPAIVLQVSLDTAPGVSAVCAMHSAAATVCARAEAGVRRTKTWDEANHPENLLTGS